MSKRIILKKLTQKVEESKGASSAVTSTHAGKGFVIQEKCPRDEVPNVTSGKMSSKGKEAMPPPEAKKKAKSTTCRSSSRASFRKQMKLPVEKMRLPVDITEKKMISDFRTPNFLIKLNFSFRVQHPK